MDTYPTRAGFTEHTTSKDAADAIEDSGKAQTLRDEVVRVLRAHREHGSLHSIGWVNPGGAPAGMTADEIAMSLCESVFSIRPRVAELHKRGVIVKTGERRKSSNGRPSHVWRLV